MGLLGKLLGTAPAKKPTDDVLLLHAIVCMAAADGSVGPEERNMINNFANTLPEFRDLDQEQFNKVIHEQEKIVHKYNKDMKSSLQALSEFSSDVIRKKAFILAVDVAMSSGEVDEDEEAMLEAMQRLLRIDDDLVRKSIEIIGLKYAK